MKAAILTDYMTTYGGAERMVDLLHELYPDADIFTSMYWPERLPEHYKKKRIFTSFLNILPHNINLLGVYRKVSFFVFRLFNLSKYDLIITNTSGPATWFHKNNNQKHISIYHKVPSFNLTEEKDRGFIQNYFAKRSIKYAQAIDLLITNSNYHADIIKKSFGKVPNVIYPPIDTTIVEDALKSAKTVNNYIEWESGSYYIFIGRLEEFKGVRYIVDACIELNKRLVVIGEGTLDGTLPLHSSIKYMGFADDEAKFILLKNAKALIHGAVEQYGIVYIESMLCGVPAIAYAEGGASELIRENENGLLFYKQNKGSVIEAIGKFEAKPFGVSSIPEINSVKDYQDKFTKLAVSVV
jgi:glycosyltransferase involved in cell wall biosynthesis